MVQKKLTIKNRAGIHARPAALLVQTTNSYPCEIFLEKDGDRVNAKSIMGIITLGAGYGCELMLTCDGAGEAEAAEAIEQLFEQKFEEE